MRHYLEPEVFIPLYLFHPTLYSLYSTMDSSKLCMMFMYMNACLYSSCRNWSQFVQELDVLIALPHPAFDEMLLDHTQVESTTNIVL